MGTYVVTIGSAEIYFNDHGRAVSFAASYGPRYRVLVNLRKALY
jgi:hypothetical protein